MQANFTVRHAVIDDCESLAKLSFEDMGYYQTAEHTRHQFERIMKTGRDVIFVAVCPKDGKDDIAGYIHAADYDLLYTGHMKNILGLAVSSDFRRIGIGSALIKAVEDWAKADNADGIRLVSGESRTAAHEFYRKQGFTSSKKQLNFKKMF